MRTFAEIEIGGMFHFWDETGEYAEFEKLNNKEAVATYSTSGASGVIAEFDPDYMVIPD